MVDIIELEKDLSRLQAKYNVPCLIAVCVQSKVAEVMAFSDGREETTEIGVQIARIVSSAISEKFDMHKPVEHVRTP
jgi:hypothetical protein